MSKSFAVLLVLAVTPLSLSCGSGEQLQSGRQLQSITIAQIANGQQVQLVATGTFSAAPITVTPLAVDWSEGLFAPPPADLQYRLVGQPFVVSCAEPGPVQFTAFAPANPNAPSSGTLPFEKIVTGAIAVNCR